MKSQVTSGKKLRTDGTVVETNVHVPSDSRQLADSVRVSARNIERARKLIEKTRDQVVEKLEDFTQIARQTARKIGEILRKRTDEAH